MQLMMRQAGRPGVGGEGSWKAAVAVCPSLLSGLKTSRPGDQQAGKVETKCPNESVNDLLWLVKRDEIIF